MTTDSRHRRAPPPRRGHRPRRGRPVRRQPLVRVGTLPRRARVGHRPRGLQRGRQRVGLLPARPCPVPRVPLERGRDGRHLGHPPRAVHGAGPVERRRPDHQGADVRADRPRGQPRRGRQGVLVVPRGAAQPRAPALALPLPAGAVPVRGPRRRERPARQAPARVRADRHRRVRRRPLLDRGGHLRQGVADRDPVPDRRREPRPRRGDAPRAAHALVPQHLALDGLGRRPRAAPGRRRA